jgi:hypothetical protein
MQEVGAREDGQACAEQHEKKRPFPRRRLEDARLGSGRWFWHRRKRRIYHTDVLFTRRFLDALSAGEVRLAFRRWSAARVRPGTEIRTSHGVVRIMAVASTELDAITERDARQAGFASVGALGRELMRRPGTLFRIELRLVGDDPRVALRAERSIPPEALASIRRRLDRLDRARGPWTEATLRLLASRPGVRAADLARVMKRETLAFKRDVRALKELGLTVSLDVGYRLSPRGRALLKRLATSKRQNDGMTK